jgi:hypothetical protein
MALEHYDPEDEGIQVLVCAALFCGYCSYRMEERRYGSVFSYKFNNFRLFTVSWKVH